MCALHVCDAGTNPETFRFYEALEAAAIPLMPRAGWDVSYAQLGEPPFPLLDAWYGAQTRARAPCMIPLAPKHTPSAV